ncbi:hypothetical protein Tco_0089980 [Tanacetum coccineum]
MTSSDEQHSQDDEVFTQIQPQITTVTNTNAKFPYLKKGDRKKTTKDSNGNIKICPPVSAEEHLAVQRETKARTTLLTALPDDHMGDFYHLDDAKEIWLAIKARFRGGHLLVLLVLTITMIPTVTTLLATLLLLVTLEIEKLLLVMEVWLMMLYIPSLLKAIQNSIGYEILKRLEKLDWRELTCKWQMAICVN